MEKIKQILVAIVSFVVLDFIWLGLVMKDFNMRQLSEIGRIENGVFQMQLAPAMVTYILMALALTFYVMPRIPRQGSFLLNTFLNGALMGLIIYGVFDTTNLAILKNYPIAFIFPDIAWGAFAFGLTTVITTRFRRINEDMK